MNKYIVTLDNPGYFNLIDAIRYLRQVEGTTIVTASNQAKILRDTRRIEVWTYSNDASVKQHLPVWLSIARFEEYQPEAVVQSPDLNELVDLMLKGDSDAVHLIAQMIKTGQIGYFASAIG